MTKTDKIKMDITKADITKADVINADMINIEKTRKKKIKGQAFAKIVWVIGALFFGLYALSSFLSMGSSGEDMIDCLKGGTDNLLYFLAFVFGLLYLFGRKHEKTALVGAVLYAAAYALGFLFNITGGSSYAAGDLLTMILSLVIYIVFTAFVRIWATGTASGAFNACLKYWYAPAGLLFLVGLVESLWTELIRPNGFLWDGFIVDMFTALIFAVPVYTMSRVIKERVKTAQK